MITNLNGFNRNKSVIFKQIYSDNLIKLKKYAGTVTGIGPSVDNNGLPVTGLTENITNPSGEVIKGTRVFMEELLDLEPGTLKQTSPYWLTYKVNLGPDAIILNLNDNYDLLKYLFLSAQSSVAIGLKDVYDSSKVEFVLYSEEQEATIKVTERKVLKKAYALSDKLDLETKIHLLAIYGEIADAANVNSIENKIDEKIENNPQKFLDYAEDDYLIYKSLVAKCLSRGVLSIGEKGIMHGEIAIGYDKENAASNIAKDNTLQAILQAKLSGDLELIQKAFKASKIKQ